MPDPRKGFDRSMVLPTRHVGPASLDLEHALEECGPIVAGVAAASRR